MSAIGNCRRGTLPRGVRPTNVRAFPARGSALAFTLVMAALLSAIALVGSNPRSAEAASCIEAATASNPIAAENTCLGTRSWLPDRPTGPDDAIEGFTNPISVQAGGIVDLYVSTTAPTYTYTIYRLGWYGGLGARRVYTSSVARGINQAAPTNDPTTRMVSAADWRDPAALTVPRDWVTGVYVVKLLSAAGYIRYMSFVVRDDASRAPVLFQSSVFTYQAYNLWGGYSLYRGVNSNARLNTYTYTERSYVVSFDRPYATHDGLGDFAEGEINVLRWLERSAYDVAYTTDADVDLSGSTLTRHKLLVVAGHGEYWSTAMRDHVTAARDAGVSLAFFGANNLYWHVRLRASPLGPDREVVCYRDALLDPVARSDPAETTVRWRQMPLSDPEGTLLGQQYAGILPASYSLRLAPGSEPLLEGSGLSEGSTLPNLAGGEFDHPFPNDRTPFGLIVLASSPVHCEPHEGTCPKSGADIMTSTLYRAVSGAWVFDAGTFQWSWGLDDFSFDKSVGTHKDASRGFQRLTANLLAFMRVSCAIPNQVGPVWTPWFARSSPCSAEGTPAT